MIIINSLKKMNNISLSEASTDSIETRYKEDIDSAKSAYEKARSSGEERNLFWIGPKIRKGSFLDSVERKSPWWLSGRRQDAVAAADRDRAIDLAEKRRAAAKIGAIPKEDVDEMRHQDIQRFTAMRKAANKVVDKTTKESETPESSGILRKITGTISEHPYLAAGTVAGIAGLAALQKRKRTEQPAQY